MKLGISQALIQLGNVTESPNSTSILPKTPVKKEKKTDRLVEILTIKIREIKK